jgi:hypothetical protein
MILIPRIGETLGVSVSGDSWVRVGEPFLRGKYPLRGVHHVIDTG